MFSEFSFFERERERAQLGREVGTEGHREFQAGSTPSVKFDLMTLR